MQTPTWLESVGTHLRRGGTVIAAAAIAAGSLTLLTAAPAAAATDSPLPIPSLSLSLPSTIGNGGDLQDGSATINNTAGSDIPVARVDFDVTPDNGTANLAPDNLVVQYDAGGGNFQSIPLVADATGGGVHGFFGPADGFDIPAGAVNTTALKVTTNPGAPTGGITVTANLDTTPGDTSSSIASDTAGITLSTPSLSFTGFPTSLESGGGFTPFSGTVTNLTGSNYGGAAPSNSPTPAGVRFDFAIDSTNAAFTGSDITLQYCLSGTGPTCTGGTWSPIPLSGSGGDLTGFFGPTGGFALPNPAINTTEFRVEANNDAPAGTVTTVVNLDKVNSSGAATGTDSSGVANGTITSSTPATTTVAPTLSLNLPSTIGNGGDLQDGSATIDNTGGSAITAARVDFDITPDNGTAALTPGDIVVKYDAGGGNFQTIPLTADSSGGGVHGFFGPSTGFPVAPGATTTTDLEVATNPGAPTGGVTVTANLDTTPGDTTTSAATDTSDITLANPALTFSGFPTTLRGGAGFTTFTGTLSNTTGSNYGGATATNSPTPAGVRVDFGINSSSSSFTASGLTLQYCLSGAGAACTGGVWTAIPLSGSGGHLTGFFGPTGGFSLPNLAVNTTEFRVEAAAAATPSTLTTTTALDKVDSSGAATGTDSNGVANGTVTTATPSSTVVTPHTVVNPTITAKVSSIQPKTKYGWYRIEATVKFTCHKGSAPLTAACPKTVRLTGNGKNRTVTRTIHATDGGKATVTVKHINIDHSAPHLRVTGAKKGHTYAHRRTLHAHCSDSLSGLKNCRVTSHRHGNTVRYVAVATDKAGNVAEITGRYFIK